jgi:FMN phosphatase YigB (HAD superfamily)
MIGDDWENDIVGAAAVGMWQIYYNPSGANKGKASYEIASWNEISTIL